MITVRMAKNNDSVLISELSRKTCHETFASENTTENMDKFMNEIFSKEILMKEVVTPANTFLLAYDGEEPVGYARMRENNNPPELENISAIEIARIYATANSIGKGVGKALMKKCVEIATEKKVTAIRLGVWQENQRSIYFYIQRGL